jgi:DNA-binding PadR family transcriptional regulator
MPIQHAVLALLADGPSHGYELKAKFEAAVGPQWGPLNIGHVYQVLDRLSRDGLAVFERLEQRVKPDRLVYEITDAGRAELARWLAEPSPRTSGFRDDFFLKVMAAAHSRDPDVVEAALRAQRVFLLQELRNLDQLRRDHAGEPVVGLLLAAATRHVNADIEFVDDAERALLDASTLAAIPVRQATHAPPTRSEQGKHGRRAG